MGCDILCCSDIIGFFSTIIGALWRFFIKLFDIFWSEQVIGYILTGIIAANYKALGRWIGKWITYKIKKYLVLVWNFVFRLGKPYYKTTDISKILHKVNVAVETHSIVIRVGKLSLNANIYRKNIKRIITAEHIWDWHFFAKSDFVAQDIRLWACDFFGYENDKFINFKENSTTQLSICELQAIRENQTVIKLFKKYKLNLAFDDLLIYGTIKECKSFPEFQDLRNQYMNNIDILGVVLFYNDGMDVKEVDFTHKELADSIIEILSNCYDLNKTLYIDKWKNYKDKKNGCLLMNELNSIINTNDCHNESKEECTQETRILEENNKND
jgi:hypothetical protein